MLTGRSMRTASTPRRTLAPWRRQHASRSTIRAPSDPPASTTLDPNGVGIAVHEWGDEDAPPLLLVHGGFDFARTYDVFAPKLAAAGWRVVAWDASRPRRQRPRRAVLVGRRHARRAGGVRSVSPGRPVPVIGHSKGGALMIAARRRPAVPVLAPRQHRRHPLDQARCPTSPSTTARR